MTGTIVEAAILSFESPFSGKEHAFAWPFNTDENKNEFFGFIELLESTFQRVFQTSLLIPDSLTHMNVDILDSVLMVCRSINDKMKRLLTCHSQKLWKAAQNQMLQQITAYCYRVSITNPTSLNKYQAFSPQVYGETNYDFVEQLINEVRFKDGEETFLDLGSGVGQVVMQVAASVKCKECVGIENAEIPYKFSMRMDENFRKLLDWFGMEYSNYSLIQGDFLDSKFDELLSRTTVIFTNNFAFGPKTNYLLKVKFQNLPEGARILSSSKFCAEDFKVNGRNLSEFGTMVNMRKIYPHDFIVQNVSWTVKNIPFYLHTIDRTRIEKFFECLKLSQSERSLKKLDSHSTFTENSFHDNRLSTTSSSLIMEFLNSGPDIISEDNLFLSNPAKYSKRSRKISSAVAQIFGKKMQNLAGRSKQNSTKILIVYESIQRKILEFAMEQKKYETQIQLVQSQFKEFQLNALSGLQCLARLRKFLQKLNSQCFYFLRSVSLEAIKDQQNVFSVNELILKQSSTKIFHLMGSLRSQIVDFGDDDDQSKKRFSMEDFELSDESHESFQLTSETFKMITDSHNFSTILTFLSTAFSHSLRFNDTFGCLQNGKNLLTDQAPTKKSPMKRCLEESLKYLTSASSEDTKRRKLSDHNMLDSGVDDKEKHTSIISHFVKMF